MASQNALERFSEKGSRSPAAQRFTNRSEKANVEAGLDAGMALLKLEPTLRNGV